ncbi:MAG: glycerol-3-phosphate 1-O-acyltransferase PlsY [Phycisphaerales bacterium JB039]
MLWPLLIALGFASGSIPFGLIIGRLRGVDIREHGSRNIGATNVMRVLGRGPGIACFILDVAKGLGPTLGAGLAMGLAGRWTIEAQPMALWLCVAAACVLGHMYSPWVRLRGGKGVATGLGALLGVFPLVMWPAVGGLVVWIALLKLTRYVSVASIAAAASLPILTGVEMALLGAQGRPAGAGLGVALGFLVALALLVIWKHRSNIARLRAGTEPPIGSPTPTRGPDPQ